MPRPGGAVLELAPLASVAMAEIVALHNDPQVRRHLPLAEGEFTLHQCALWLADKQQHWWQHGYGPWALRADGAFAGWGGLQDEQGEADLALVLAPAYWGHGLGFYRRIIQRAFVELKLPAVTALLPPSRERVKALARLGFQRDGQLQIGSCLFYRYRLHAPAAIPVTDPPPVR